MDWVPLFFIDAVCHQLQHETFQEVSELSAVWSEFGAEHHEKRREFAFYGKVDGMEIRYCLEDMQSKTYLLAADLDLEFDRISSVSCNSAIYCSTRASMEEHRPEAFLNILSLAANCTWYLRSGCIEQNRIFFEAFKNCPGFTKITINEQGRESLDFVARQVELGNVQKLYLHSQQQSINWPELEKLSKTFKTFVSSARFNCLKYNGVLTNDIELFALFLERAFAGELKRGACISLKNNITFDKSQRIARLRPECRENPIKLAWRIPNSRRRVKVEQFQGSFYISVE